MDDPVAKVLLALGSKTEDLGGQLEEILRRLESLEVCDGKSPRRVA